MGQSMKSAASRFDAAPVRETASPSPRPWSAPAPSDAVEACNPVLRLQQDIEAAWTRPAEPRWSARRTLIFVLLTNGLFWAGLVLGVRAIG